MKFSDSNFLFDETFFLALHSANLFAARFCLRVSGVSGLKSNLFRDAVPFLGKGVGS